MGMQELLEKNQCATMATLGPQGDDITIQVSNASPTLSTVTVLRGDRILYQGEASLGQLRALVTESARALNILLQLQNIPGQPVSVDGVIPR